MKIAWKECLLGDCVTLQSGGTPSKQNPAYWNGNIPWVSCKDMKTNRLHDAEDHLTPEGAKNGTRTVRPGTILIVVRGMILAKDFPVAIAQRELAFNQDLKSVTCTQDIDRDFLYYWLIGNKYEIKGIVDEAAHGTSRIQTDRLLSLKFSYPSLPTQRKIAGILSAYDDLIENNQRRIKILEEMAQSLYREWFVHFRFPGHESARFTASPLGQIPAGWEVKKLGELAEVNAESIRASNAPEEIQYIDIASVSTGAIDNIELMRFEAAPSRARRVVRHGDIIWSTVRPNRRSFSLIIDPEDNVIASTGFAVLTARSVPWSYLYQATTTDDFTSYLVNHASGAAYPAVNSGIFENADVLVPTADLLTRFNAMAKANQLLQHKLQRRNQTLRRTRDLLLPKLLSPV
ncbi:MAG: restriction endonuclease subunit S [Verrucomicrobiota bacterium]